MKIENRVGDVLASRVNGLKLIPHVCNDMGGWGSGFVVAISRKWSQPEAAYRKWSKSKSCKQLGVDVPFGLGNTQFIRTEDNTVVANMVAQHNTIHQGYKPIRYASLMRCMERVAAIAMDMSTRIPVEIHAPKFGSALAGGNWDFIEELINEIWVANNIKVVIFTFPEK